MGKVPEWISLYKVILPTREKYSKIVGMWTTDVAQLNQIVHLWAYNDLNHRAEVRAKVAQEPAWKEFLAKSGPLLVEMQSIVLTPSETSPLR